MRLASLDKLTDLVREAWINGILTRTEKCDAGTPDECAGCHGYINPAAYGAECPCKCGCHETWNPADYKRAEHEAYLEYYVAHQRRYGI